MLAGGRAAAVGRVFFGVSMIPFGIAHFVYAEFVGTLVPSWIPGGGLFWAYATGVAHCAAGLAILTSVLGRLAAILAGIMFASWVLVLHLPRVVAHTGDRAEWTSLFVATAAWGGAWIIAATFPRRP